MPIFDFDCGEHVTELLRPRDCAVTPCPVCERPATRPQVNRIAFTGFAQTSRDGRDWSRDYARFNEATETLAYQKERFEDAAQVHVADPNLFKVAKVEAQKLANAGVTADQI